MKTIDNTALWNEAAKAGFLFGAISVGCLLAKELAGLSSSPIVVQGTAVILWVVEFFGCILLMKKVMLDLKDKYEDAKMADTRILGRRAALLSGLILASAQALVIMYAPAETMDELIGQVTSGMNFSGAEKEAMEGMIDHLPLLTFVFQWLYCTLYGSLLASFMSRYIFLQKLFQ